MAEAKVVWYNPAAAWEVTLGDGVNVKPGTLLSYGASGWVLADADAVTTYAQAIALEHRREDDDENAATCMVSREAMVEDTDAPFTADELLYLSSTAGAITATRPVATTTARNAQCVGVSISTSLRHIKINPPHEMHEYQQFVKSNLGAAAETALDSGNFYAAQMDADNDVVALTVVVPDKAVSLVEAFLHCAEEAEASTVELELSVSSALADADHDAVTPDTSEAYVLSTLGAVDQLQKIDCSAAFNATNIIRPGATLAVKCLADLGGTDIVHAYGITFIWKVVD